MSEFLPRKENLRCAVVLSVVLFALPASLLAQSGTPSLDSSSIFLEAPIYGSSGNFTQAIAAGDVNGDGKLDLVVVNCQQYAGCTTPGSVAVLLGNGDGSFQVGQAYSAQAYALALADVNGDGKLDIVLAGGNSNSVGVLLGNGDGTFQPVQYYSSGGTNAVSVAVADVNHDGKLDLVVANGAGGPGVDGAIGVLLGNGDGTFQAPHSYDSGGFETASVVVADVNGDGRPDVLAVSLCPGNNCSGGGVLDVLLNNGNGTLQAAQNDIFGSDAPRSIAAGDVNGDGKIDVVVASGAACNNTITCIGGAATVLLGNGDGTFRTAQSYSTGGFLGQYPSRALAIADVNGDGKPDLVVADAYSISINSYSVNGDVSLLMGNGDGTFRPAQVYSSGAYNAASVVVGDVNGDGKIDVVVADNCIIQVCSLIGSVGVLLGNGDGTLRAAPTYPSGGWIPYVIAVGDINADGKSDLVVANRCENVNNCPGGGVGVLFGNGDGTFQAPQSYSTGVPYPASSIAVADVNGDDKPDIFVAGPCPDTTCGATSGEYGVVAVLLNKDDGTFQAAQNYSSGAPIAVAVAVEDVNGDGKPDIVVTNAASEYVYDSDCGDFFSCYEPSGPPTLGVLLGNGDGTFQAAKIYALAAGNPLSVAIADVNGDGKQDVLVVSDTAPGTVGVLLGNGDGTFQAVQTYSSGGYQPYSIAVGDLNGDGKPDLVVGNYCTVNSSDGCVGNGTVAVLPGNGDGTFRAPLVTMMPGEPGLPLGQMGQIGLGDFNGDGYLDVATVGFLLLGKGNGTFQAPVYLGAGGGAGTAVGDFNGDGKPDLAVGAVTTLLNIAQRPPVATKTSLRSSANPAGVNQAVTFTAIVIGRGWIPTGIVTFKNALRTMATVPLVNGQAAYTTAFSAIGNQPITAVYSGDANNLKSTSSTLNEVVLVGTTTSLVTSNASAIVGQPVTFTATVTGQSGTPTGAVTFTINRNKPVTVPLANGRAAFNWTFAISGARTVTAVYSGNATYAPSASAPLNEIVSSPVVTIGGSPQQPLTKNGSGNFVVRVTITNTGNVTIASAQVTTAGTTLGAAPLLVVPPAVTNLAPGASAVVTLTFPDTAALSAATTAPLKVSGTYSVPSIPLIGNWALSFRSVSL